MMMPMPMVGTPEKDFSGPEFTASPKDLSPGGQILFSVFSKNRSEGASHRNGLCKIRAHVRARVGAAVRLWGAAGQVRFVVAVTWGSVFFGGRSRGRAPHGCVLLIEI